MYLSEFLGVNTPPKYEAEFLRFMNPLLDAMREKGGQARPREIYEANRAKNTRHGPFFLYTIPPPGE